ncbi:MAG: hypothetical protein MUD08_09605 [Cytophagales bacterium]|jgi:hypothetical protein|nr:hypothetical protein [Cytophagales bacterium]
MESNAYKVIDSSVSVLVFKTNVNNKPGRRRLARTLEDAPGISRWSVDLSDCDCVLRIESDSLSEINIIGLVKQAGFVCEELEG